MMRKTPESVRGYKIRCPNFSPCPLCYGCRNYDPSFWICRTECSKDKKNTCDKEKHTDKILAMMLQKQVVQL